MKSEKLELKAPKTIVEKVICPFTNGNKDNNFYGFKRSLKDLILQIPMQKGVLLLSARRSSSSGFHELMKLSSEKNIRVTFLNSICCPDFFLRSEYSEFKLSIYR